MVVQQFNAVNFRNIENVCLDFSEGVNLLYGQNAQGKTNAIEGIYFFARGKSFRGASDRELCRFGCEGYSLSLSFQDKKRENKLEYVYHDGSRKKTKNGYKIKKISEMIDAFHAVLFTPDHLRLVKDGPEERRGFLNVGIAGCTPEYLKIYADYKKAQEERNCLLRMAQKGLYTDEREIEAFSLSLAKYAADIYLFRKNYIEKIGKYAGPFLSEMTAKKEILDLRYKSDIGEARDKDEAFLAYRKIFTENTEKEIAAGTTLFGPVREDMDITIGGKKARAFASQGQQRSVALALKYAEGEVCKEAVGEYPVYLFDDVFSELDEQRKAFILRGLENRQILITSCEKIGVGVRDVNAIEVKGGSYVSSYR